MEEFYPLDRITLSAPSVPEEELCVQPENPETIAIENEMDEILMKLAESFCQSFFVEITRRLEILIFGEALLNGEENLWFLVGDALHEGIDRDFEKLVCEILDFNPFGELLHNRYIYPILVTDEDVQVNK